MDPLDVIINNLSPHERWVLRQATMPDKITYTPQVDLFERPTQDEINEFLNKQPVPLKEVDLSTLSEKPSNIASWLLALQAAGQLANTGNEAILDGVGDSPNANDVQDLVYKNSWGEVLNNSKRRNDINDMITSDRKDFSNVRNIANLQNTWNPNMQQSNLRKMNGWQTFGSIGTSAVSDAAQGAATGFAAGTMFTPIGQEIGAGVGAAAGFLSGLGRGIAGAVQGNRTVDYGNKLIDQTNTYNLNSYFDTAKSIRKNMYKNIQAEGGPMESLNGLTFFNTGGTHGSNPLGGIPQGVDSEGVPNLVEQGEVKYNDYIFSSRNKISESLLNKYNLPKNLAGKTFAEVATKLQEDSQERPYDPVSVNGLEDSMGKLTAAQEEVRAKKSMREQRKNARQFPDGGFTPSHLRYFPAVSSALQALTDQLGLTNRPDYTLERMLRRNASELKPVAPVLNTNYLEYNPYNTEVASNRIQEQAASNLRLAREARDKGNQAAIVTGMDNATGTNSFLANLEAQQANQKLKQAVTQYNNSIKAANQNTIANYDKMNLELLGQRLNILNAAAQARDASETARGQALSTNRTNAANQIGKVGLDATNFELQRILGQSGAYGVLNEALLKFINSQLGGKSNA